jgi:hypothetical protein|tara:strand:+ start:136 stop:1596 length:1461 start_codon:yes stop_codon:yes gene_type:complete
VIQELLYLDNENTERCFSNPPVVVKENKHSPLLGYAGIVPVRNLVGRLDIASILDSHISVLKRHKPYFESDHILNFVYNFLTGGEVINDIERLQEAEGILRILGTERIPDPTTAGDFLVRFKQKDIEDFQRSFDQIQNSALSLLDPKRKEVATIEHDSSIHEVYGEKKEGADYAYENTYSYNVQYVTLAETGDVLQQELREGNRYSSYGVSAILPGIFDRVGEQFKHLRYRADSASYDKAIVGSCEERGVEFYISADQTQKLMQEVLSIDESEWKSFRGMKLAGKKKRSSGRKRKKRKNQKKKVQNRRKPNRERRGKTEIASFFYQPVGWEKPYRYVVKRTEVVDRYGQQCLEEGLCKYIYHIIVTNNFEASDTQAMHVAQGRANQENLIKDLKYGLGLSHVPTGFFLANQIYFKIAALAWNIKTWMLNLLSIGDGAVLRFKRFLYLWINHACVVSKTGRTTVVIRMDPGEYYSRYAKALDAIARL